MLALWVVLLPPLLKAVFVRAGEAGLAAEQREARERPHERRKLRRNRHAATAAAGFVADGRAAVALAGGPAASGAGGVGLSSGDRYVKPGPRQWPLVLSLSSKDPIGAC